MSLRNRNKTYDWARFGGIEEDESLDVIKYEIEIQFPIRSFDSNTKIYTFEPVPIDLNDDLFVAPPSSVYHIDWGDGNNRMLNFREFTNDWQHTYSREDSNNSDRVRFTITIKGHDLIQRKNNEGMDFIAQTRRIFPSTFYNSECLIIVRSVE